jgi:23S rRNA (uracil1939-C5)-methyltransferase
VLHPDVGERIGALAALVDGLSIRDQVPQIEVAKGEGPCVLVFRVLATPSAADLEALMAFAAAQDLRVYLQEGGPETIRPLPGQAVDLHYRLPDFGVNIHFEPTDFTQVNLELNRLMVRRAVDLLDPQPDEGVLDLFCGLGNFTLPLARRAARVTGVEGDAGLVERARRNALANGIDNAAFQVADLYGSLETVPWMGERFDKVLLDPPRAGALQVLDFPPTWGPGGWFMCPAFPPPWPATPSGWSRVWVSD